MLFFCSRICQSLFIFVDQRIRLLPPPPPFEVLLRPFRPTPGRCPCVQTTSPIPAKFYTAREIHNDLILAMDRCEVTSLILLDLSAAFDTVDHSILLTRLQNWFGLVCLLIGSHLISHFALGLSQSMIPSLHSLLFPVVYPKVSYLAHSVSLSIQLLLAR